MQLSESCNRSVRRPRGTGRCRGLALILVMIALALALTLALTFVSETSTSIAISRNVQGHAHARQIAETGLTVTMAYIRRTPDWRNQQSHGVWVTDEGYGGGTFTITGLDEVDDDLANDPTHPMKLTAWGKYKGVVHQVSIQVVPQPPPLGTLLVVVPDPANLSNEEKRRLRQFRKWYYEIELIDDGALQSEYDAATADALAIYVTNEVAPTQVGPKLADSPVGVVFEQPGLWQDFGFANVYAGIFTSRFIDVLDNTHYITQPFGIGPLTLTDTDQLLVASDSPMPGGVARLAGKVAAGGTTLGALEAGGVMATGADASGRRVALPIGGIGFAWDSLTVDGLEVVKRSIHWATLPPKGPPPFAHWRLDDASGLTASDSAGDHDGQVFGGAPWTLGQIIGGLVFDGLNDYVVIPHHDDFDVTSGFSVGAWLRADSWGLASDVDVILRKGEGNPNRWQFMIQDGKVALALDNYDGVSPTGNTVLTTNEWHHVVATWDGKTIRFFVDGVADGEAARAGTIGTDIRPIYMGGRIGTQDLFDGILDDVRFYDRPISPAEIRVMHDEGRFDDGTPNMVALFEFEEVKPKPAKLGHWALNDSGSGGGGIASNAYIQIRNSARVDSYESSKGPYVRKESNKFARVMSNSTGSGRFVVDTSASLFGDAYCGPGGDPATVIVAHAGAISGKRLALPAAVPMADYAAPAGMPASQGAKSIAVNQVWSTDQTFDTLTLWGAGKTVISGDVRVWVTGILRISQDHQIVVAPGSRLRIYAGGDVFMEGDARVNADTTGADRLEIYLYQGTNDYYQRERAVVSSVLRGEDTVKIEGDAHFFGSIISTLRVEVRNYAQVHTDLDLPGVGGADAPVVDETNMNPGLARNGVGGGSAGARAFTRTALSFDGVDDHVEIPHHDSYLVDSGAVAFWFRTSDVSLTQGLFSKDSADRDTGGQLTIDLDNEKVRVRLESVGGTEKVNSGDILPDTWVHVVFTFGPDGMNLYVDGTLVDTDTYTGGMAASSGGVGNYEPILLGASTEDSADLAITGWTNPLSGMMDEVRFYSYALDGIQVNELYTGAALSPSTLPGSVVYDAAGYGASLDLGITDTTKIAWLDGGGLELVDKTIIASILPAKKLIQALGANDQMAVEVIFAPSDLGQSGPAAIASFAGDRDNQNFSIGQTGKSYSPRLRTTLTTLDGRPEIESEDVLLSTDELQHLIFSFDGENVRVYR
ncbi:MAG: LamG domain-containing protein, partial [Phycisphaerae bacterium]|nr:LamG domain-containing protein [Phycisphaerae bacterium]